MKKITLTLFLFVLFVQSYQETLTVSDSCTCIQILSSNDCSQRSDCQWNTSNASCETVTITLAISYCTQSTTCPISGCAYWNKTCQPFSGCTYYTNTTHADCQTVSTLCTSNGTNCILIGECQNIKNEIGCIINSNNKPCFWDSTQLVCSDVSTCNQLPTTYTTDTQCRSQISTCTVTSSGGCVSIGQNCSDNKEEIGCITDLSNNVCFWNSSCFQKICTNAPTTYTTNQLCRSFLSTCSLNALQQGCIDNPSSCNSYTIQQQCISIDSTICYWNDTSCVEWTCENAPSKYTTDLLCQEYKNECTIGTTGCIKRLTSCNLYTLESQCVKTLDETINCYWNGTTCVNKTCENVVLITYSDFTCQQYLSQCTLANTKCGIKTCSVYLDEDTCSIDYQNKKCSWSGSCTNRTCDNADSTLTTHAECYKWLTSCTVQSDLSGCITQSTICTNYTEDQCYYAKTIQCLWSNNKCIQKTCSTASTDISSDDECASYLDSNICMINSTSNGCIDRGSTCNELLQNQCTTIIDGSKCFWNGTQCVVRSCDQANYNTYTACNNFLSTCTINVSNDIISGCISYSDTCDQYTSQSNCIISNGGKCIWNTKTSPAACQLRTCSNSDSTSSDDACNRFLDTCTVNSSKTGCITRYTACNLYSVQIMCVKNLNGDECLWYSNECVDKTCDLADKTLTTHDQCQSFSTKCTTNGKGCIELNTCSSNSTKQGCVIDKNNNNCAYQSSCNGQQCQDAPQSYTTDTQCLQYNSDCTTNGNGCVQRMNCSDAYIEAACVTDSSGNLCYWINNKCINYSCASAPSKYTTELECLLYQSNCTVSQTGGCVTKGLCTDAKIKTACTTDINGIDCQFSTTGCRYKVCSDYTYTTHSECYTMMTSCTTNGTNCVTQTTCALKQQSGCYYGSDGPCLWVNNSCYQYNDCTSLQFTTHDECYEFNNQCTTNGANCIALDKCSNLSQLSCFQGTDGVCVYTPETLNGTSSCKLYVDCTTAVFSTHIECQAVNSKCTTDGNTCITLLTNCSDYKLETNCVLTNSSVKCYYDSTNNTCSDLTCDNLTYTTDDTCSSNLSTCTTDTTKCITKSKCQSYSSTYCNSAKGTDGRCVYDPTTSLCRVALCTELQSDCTSVTKCLDSGQGCVGYDLCANYTTEKACEYGGSDGMCVWQLTNGEASCSLMTQCSDASSNKSACQSKSWNCQWTETSTTTTCAQYTCSSYASTSGSCSPILDFTKANYILCATSSSQCISTEFASLTSSTCFVATTQTYTWDSANSKCLKCGTTYNNSTSNNSTNNTNNSTNGSYSQILIITLFILINY